MLSALSVAPVARAAGAIYVTTTNQEINSDAECSLQEAIYSANRDDNTAPDPANPGSDVTTGCAAGSGDDTIYLPANALFPMSDPIDDYDNPMGPTATPMVTSTIDIEGQGARLQRNPYGHLTRAFAVAPDGDLTLHEMDVKGFGVHGGNGKEGGGGGLGAGGAVYVVGGRLGIGWSTFEGNVATGGNGGSAHNAAAFGGGGGLSGNGGSTTADYGGGGGGGGSRGDGADGGYSDGGGGGGTVTSGVDSTPGESCGGEGGVYDAATGGADDGSPGCSGGGGGGGTERIPFFDPFGGGDGADGGYGGGGGGSGEAADGGHGGFGGGGGGAGAGDNGGDGGFGGGGGSGQELDIGGGLHPGSEGAGGTFAGHGGEAGGGGGAALGGAIFGDNATIVIQNSTFAGNSVNHGLAGNSAQNGADGGGAIFAVDGFVNINNVTISGNDSTGSGAGLVMYKSTRGNAASLRMRNSIIGGNTGHDECFVLGGVSNAQSANNLVTLHGTDDTATPCFNINLGDDPALGSLQLNAPGKTPTMALLPGSPAIGGADPATATPDDQRGVFRDAEPDLGAFEFSGQAPVTTISLSPSSPDGSNGWYVSPVDVTVNATDADSTVAQTRCALDPASVPASFDDLPNAACAIGTISADGLHSVYAASVDTENNVELPVASASFKIDQTDPVLAPSLSSTTVTLGQSGVTASANATDATSGVASSSCDPVDTSTAGKHTIQCTATDNAGNTNSASIDYVVGYRMLGFFSPVPGSKWLAGQTVPIKIALAQADGTRISDAEAQALAQQCAVTFSVSGSQSKQAQCLKYDPVTDQFIYNWKLGKRPLGAATIVVSVSYSGTTTSTQLSEQITIARS